MPTRLAIPIVLAAVLAPTAAVQGQSPDPGASVPKPPPAVEPPPVPPAPPPGVQPPPMPPAAPLPSGAGGPYFVVRGGVSTTRSGESGPDRSGVPKLGEWEVEDAFDLEAGVGTRIARLLTGELTVGGRRDVALRRGFDGTEDVTQHVSAGVTHITASLRVFAPLRAPFRLYGILGGAAYRVDIRYDETGRVSGPQPRRIFSDNPFGFVLGVGAGLALSEKLRLDVELKAAPMSAVFAGERIQLGGGRAVAGLQLEL